MTRFIIYSLLLCLIAAVAYRHLIEPGPPREPSPTATAPHLSPRQTDSAAGPARPPEDLPPPSALPPPPAVPSGAAAQDKAFREKYSAAARSFTAGDFESALRLFRELAREERSFIKYVGASLFRMGSYSDAVVHLEQAAEQEPSDFSVRKMLAFAYHKLDDPSRGLVHSEAGLSLAEDGELRLLHEKLKRDRAAQKDFIGESSSHFTVLFNGYEHGNVNREVLGLLEDAYSVIGRDLGVYPRTRTTVILYTDRDFFDTTQAPSWSGAIYDGKIRVPMRRALDNKPRLKQVLFHEYTHAAIHSLAPVVPVWVNEGLAEYFSRTYPRSTGQAIPLTSLEQSFLGLRGENAAMAYWESYSAVSHIMDRYGAHRMKTFLESLGRGEDMRQAFGEAFGIPYRDFLSQWGKN